MPSNLTTPLRPPIAVPVATPAGGEIISAGYKRLEFECVDGVPMRCIAYPVADPYERYVLVHPENPACVGTGIRLAGNVVKSERPSKDVRAFI